MEEKMPLGFDFALAQNPDAMKAFAGLPQEQRDELLRRAAGASSKGEMQALVDGLRGQ